MVATPTPVAEKPAAKLVEYRVTADAVVLNTGPKSVQRFRRGARLRLLPGADVTADLLASRSIALASSDVKHVTARQVFAALGAEPDPAINAPRD